MGKGSPPAWKTSAWQLNNSSSLVKWFVSTVMVKMTANLFKWLNNTVIVTLELVITTQRQLINLHDLQGLSKDNPVKVNTQPVATAYEFPGKIKGIKKLKR